MRQIACYFADLQHDDQWSFRRPHSVGTNRFRRSIHSCQKVAHECTHRTVSFKKGVHAEGQVPHIYPLYPLRLETVWPQLCSAGICAVPKTTQRESCLAARIPWLNVRSIASDSSFSHPLSTRTRRLHQSHPGPLHRQRTGSQRQAYASSESRSSNVSCRWRQ